MLRQKRVEAGCARSHAENVAIGADHHGLGLKFSEVRFGWTCRRHDYHVGIEVALGRVRRGGVVTVASLLDPSRQAELLIQLAAMPPRQPITVPRSFANTALGQTLSPCAKDGPPASAAAVAPGTPGLPLPPNSGRAAPLGATVLRNLPPIPHPEKNAVAWQALSPGIAGTANGTAFDPVSTPDVGDKGPPAIVPLAPGSGCNDGA